MSLDRYVHENPAFVASSLRWIVAAYRKELRKKFDDERGLLIPWGMVGLALVAPARIRNRLPKTASAKLAILLDENPSWKPLLPLAIRAWSEPFWAGMRYGIVRGVLGLDNARVMNKGRMKAPASDLARELKKKAELVGKLFAAEGTDRSLGTVLGIEFEP